MCGIAGFTGNGGEAIARRMIEALRHRGPDALGWHADGRIALAHARLAILDLRPEGNCPMFTHDRSHAIVFNGEIYNYLELREELARRHPFRTTTDTEVLLYLYKELGPAMLDRLNGMFAIAIHDFGTGELFLARDRMGKKPLYYARTDTGLVFASELKAMMQHPAVPRRLSLEAINQYLTFDYVPAPASIVEGVSKLEPAHYLLVKDGEIREKAAYWKHDFPHAGGIGLDAAAARLDTLLDAATRRRLISDVPLGVFLSGGLDSSTVAYYAQRNASAPIQTFSITFDDASYDEGGYAQQVARHLGTEHHEQRLTPQRSIALVDEIYPLVDEPFADASLIPTYFLSQFTRQRVTVALGGDGSDELQAGYPTFLSERFTWPLRLLPAAVPKALLRMAELLLPASDRNISFDFKVKQFLRGFEERGLRRHQLWLGSFTPAEKRALLRPEALAQLRDPSGLSIIDRHLAEAGRGWSHWERLTFLYYRTYLPDDILFKVDRASMYNSLEVRAPFMDREVVEFFNALPWPLKQHGLSGKRVLKRCMAGKLPHGIIHRPKKGFGIPLSAWIRGELRKAVSDTLLAPDPLFEPGRVRALLEEHLAGRRNHRKLLWNLFMLKRYMEHHPGLGL